MITKLTKEEATGKCWEECLGIIYDHDHEDREDTVDSIQGEVLNFCCCGDPEANLKFVRDCLVCINNLHEKVKPSGDMTIDEYNNECKRIMGNAELFIRYVFDKEELTEHGGSVYGSWLTEDGIKLMERINKLGL